MLTTGLAIAGITVTGFWIIFQKLPKSVKKFMKKHHLLTDCTAAMLTYFLFAGTITGLIAAAWSGLIVSLMLALASNPSTAAMMDRWAEKLAALKNGFVEWAAKQCDQQEEPKLRAVK